MGKKKPFIDKKNSSTYHIVRRSQRDVGGYYDESTGEAKDVPSEFLLMPSPETLKKQEQQQWKVERVDSSRGGAEKSTSSGVLSKMKSKLGEAGLLDEEYDYDRHMKPITGSGVYFSGANGGVDSRAALGDARALSIPLNDEIRELDRDLDAIALSQDCMDDDIAQALFGDFEEGHFEEILDDFCITAAQEPTQEELQNADNDDNDDFDFDAHIQSLINKAKTLENGGSLHSGRQIQDDFFTGKKPLYRQMEDHPEDDDDDSLDAMNEVDEESTFFREATTLELTTGVVAKLAPDEEQALVEKFEMALAEYDSDEVGDLDNECMEIGGDKPLEGDKQIDAVFDDFLTVKRDEIFIQGTRNDPHYKRNGGSGFSALVGKRMVVSKGLKDTTSSEKEQNNEPIQEQTENVKDILAQADQILANPEMDLPPEEVLIDGKSYFTERTVNPWDCESILSTYSNLDNNPATISRTGNRRRKKKSQPSKTDSTKNHHDTTAIPEDQPAQILLSQKTGLPIGVLPTKSAHYTDDDTLASVNKGEARRKGETKEEKRARKQAVKQEKKISQFQKKIMQEAFAEEFGRRNTSVMTNDVGGKSVFRYS